MAFFANKMKPSVTTTRDFPRVTFVFVDIPEVTLVREIVLKIVETTMHLSTHTYPASLPYSYI